MADKPRDPPRTLGGQPPDAEGKERLGRGGGRFGKKRRKRDRRTGSEGGGRLRSARDGMEDSPEAENVPASVLREFPAGGEPWVAWEGGRASYGPPSSPSATLIEILFARDSKDRRPTRSILAAIPSLDDVSHERLLAFWRSAEAYRNPRDAAPAASRGRREDSKE